MKKNQQYDCTKIEYNCDYCGKKFQTKQWKLDLVNSGERTGVYCSNRCSALSRGTNIEKICECCGKKYILKKCYDGNRNERFCSRECYLEYISNERENSLIIKNCIVCGKEFSVTQSRFNQVHCSRICAGESCSLDLTDKKFGFLTAKEKVHYKDVNRTYWKCECVCGNETVVEVSCLTGKTTMSCGCMKTSIFETLVGKYLDNNRYNYMRQYTFEDCIYKNKLYFDYYLNDFNILIEVDGEQHFHPVSIFGGEVGFKETQIRDKIKNKYCEDNNIILIRIPYWEKNNIDSFMDKELNNIIENRNDYIPA